MPTKTLHSARDVEALWRKRLLEVEEGHPFWLYTHIPFCPQICSFCQCSTEKLLHGDDLERYLEWLEGEIAFLSPAVRRGKVVFQYIGGGTPNVLSDAQLERLLTTLNEHFRFDAGARRTFEFLPSSLRPGTIDLVRRFGYNRLSCGVQSQQPQTLLRVHRSADHLDELGEVLEHAYGLGYDEINLDLIWGLASETHEQFVEGLVRTLATSPTTVTIHKLIALPVRPRTPEEELELDRRFVGLAALLAPVLEARAPQYTVLHRIASLVVVKKDFLAGPGFSFSYYSDNERIHYDMLGLGRYAASRIMGRCLYDCVSRTTSFDPDEKAYDTCHVQPSLDAALDLVTALVADRRCDLDVLGKRYGDDSLTPLQPELKRLEDEEIVTIDRSVVHYEPPDFVYIDPLAPLLDAGGGRIVDLPPRRGVTLHLAEGVLQICVERARRDARYFEIVGQLGVYYSVARGVAPPPRETVERLLAQAVSDVRDQVDHKPDVEPAAVLEVLEQRLSSKAATA